MFVAECAGEPGPGREGQGPAAADGAGCQRAGSEGLCQTLSDPSGEEEFLIHRWNHLDAGCRNVIIIITVYFLFNSTF